MLASGWEISWGYWWEYIRRAFPCGLGFLGLLSGSITKVNVPRNQRVAFSNLASEYHSRCVLLVEAMLCCPSFKGRGHWDFPGSLVVKTLCLSCRRQGLDPWVGNEDPAGHTGEAKKIRSDIKTNKIQRERTLTPLLNGSNVKEFVIVF